MRTFKYDTYTHFYTYLLVSDINSDRVDFAVQGILTVNLVNHRIACSLHEGWHMCLHPIYGGNANRWWRCESSWFESSCHELNEISEISRTHWETYVPAPYLCGCVCQSISIHTFLYIHDTFMCIHDKCMNAYRYSYVRAHVYREKNLFLYVRVCSASVCSQI